MSQRTSVLKQNPARTVLWVEGSASSGPRVVKRFHHPQPLRALRDGPRARREHRMLEALHAAGLAVPEPLGLERTAEGWEVHMRWIPGARPLDELAEDGELTPDLPRALGRSLARLHELGIEHRDLHPGNVLVSEQGTAFLVDFARARRRARRPPRELSRDLEVLAAGSREFFPWIQRARFLDAWYAHLSADLREAVGPKNLLAARIESGARHRRRWAVRRGQGRWLRPSSRCRVEGSRSERIFLRSGLPGAGDLFTRSNLHRIEGALEQVKAAWLHAARLEEHRVPCLAPLGLRTTGNRALAVFEQGLSLDGPRAAADIGRLLGTLHERGLDLSPGALRAVRDGAGICKLVPPAVLLDFDPRPGTVPLTRRLRAIPHLEPSTEARRGYLAAFRHQPRERRALEVELAEGR